MIAPGARADLLVIDGNPLDDIRVLTTPERTLRLIMKGGQIFKNELCGRDRVSMARYLGECQATGRDRPARH